MTDYDRRTGGGDDLAGRPAVIAVTADDDRYAETRRRAMQVAADDGARLILYDWDAATLLGDPLPSAWSAAGTEEAVPSELDASDLEAAGRASLVPQLADAERMDVRATAWLPSRTGAEALATFAQEHRATAIVVPEDLQAEGELERLLGGPEDQAEAVRRIADVRVIVVPRP